MRDTAPVTRPDPGRPPLFTRDYVLTTLGTFSFFASFMYLLSVLPDYIDEIGGEEWQVGLVVGAFGLLPLLMRPHVGRWCDQGKRLLMMRLATLVFALALFLMVFSQDVWSLLALRLVQGTGMALWPTPATALAAEIIPTARRGEGLGFFGMAASGAQITMPALGVVIADAWGFDAVFIVSAVTALATLAFTIGVQEPRGAPAGAGAAPPTLFPRGAIFPMTIFLTFTFAWSAAATFLPLLGKERDLGNVGLFFLVMGVITVLARPTAGRISDQVGRVRVAVVGLLVAAAGMLLLAQAQSGLAMLLAGGITGLGFAAVHTTMLALAIDRVRLGQRGGATAIFQVAWDLGQLIAGVGLGFVASAIDVETVFWVSGVLLLVGVAALLGGRTRGWTRPHAATHPAHLV